MDYQSASCIARAIDGVAKAINNLAEAQHKIADKT